MIIKVFYNNEPLLSKYEQSIGNNILKQSLRKNDVIEIFPFNFFDNLETTTKSPKENYHTVLKIDDIKYTFLESWNSTIDTIVEIYLIEQV